MGLFQFNIDSQTTGNDHHEKQSPYNNKIRFTTVAGASVLSSVLFFVITNFGVWLTTGLYTPNISGLMTSYAAAIPFFHNTLLGDALFSGLLFGGFALFGKYQNSRYSDAQNPKCTAPHKIG